MSPASLGIGLAALGRPAYLTSGRGADLGDNRSVEAMRQRTAEVLDAAYAAGIRYIDAARSYGRAEEFLAAWLAARPEVTDVTIASKWGYRYVGEWRMDGDVHEIKDHSVESFEAQLDETRRHLGGSLSVYQVHSVTVDSPALTDPHLHRELARLRTSGVRIGLSTSGPRQAEAVRRAMDVDVDGEPLFTVVQSSWNLLEPSVGPALAEAASRGASVVIKECLANGRLVDDARAADLTRQRGIALDLDVVAMASALSQPWANYVLTGAVTVGQIARNAQAAAVAESGDLLDLSDALAEEPSAYWSARSRRAWG